MGLPELIEDFKRRIKWMEAENEDMDSASWNYEEGLIISGNEAKAIIEFYNERKPVKAVKDDDGHWYVIPNDLIGQFYKLLEGGESTEAEFIELFSGYMTGGDLNLIQLYAKL